MARFVFIPGAGGDAWMWHLVVDELGGRGHEAIAVDIREDDPELGLEEYAQQVLHAVAGDPETTIVAHSMGAFTAPVVAERTPLRALVLLNPMTPLPGETPGEWWGATGQHEARVEADRAAGRDTEWTDDTPLLPRPARGAARAGAQARARAFRHPLRPARGVHRLALDPDEGHRRAGRSHLPAPVPAARGPGAARRRARGARRRASPRPEPPGRAGRPRRGLCAVLTCAESASV